jgi:hypothetical protein
MKYLSQIIENIAQLIIMLAALLILTPFGWIVLLMIFGIIITK